MAIRKNYIDRSDIDGMFRDLSSYANGITATASGTQTTAYALSATYNRVTTVATAGDAVKLPKAVNGSSFYVFNTSANSMNVFPNTGDAINALSANAAYALAAGKGAEFICMVNGTWNTMLSA